MATAREVYLIHEVIGNVGLTSNYRGHRYVEGALTLLLENQKGGIMITKDIYPVLAGRFQVPAGRVEQNIRFSIEMVWKKNRDTLERIAGAPLFRKPSNLMFLMILIRHLLRQNGIDVARQSPIRVRE